MSLKALSSYRARVFKHFGKVYAKNTYMCIYRERERSEVYSAQICLSPNQRSPNYPEHMSSGGDQRIMSDQILSRTPLD